MTLFTYTPSYGATNDVQPKLRKAQFGDGYSQRQADGINNAKEVWTVSFADRASTEIDAIETFLKGLNGAYFTWIPPRQSVAKKFICEKWSRSINKGNIDSINAVFEQVFDA